MGELVDGGRDEEGEEEDDCNCKGREEEGRSDGNGRGRETEGRLNMEWRSEGNSQ